MIPCARVLSVSELLAKRERFLLRKRLFPEVEEAPFLGETPTRVDVPEESAICPLEECNGRVVRLGTHGLGGGYTPYWEARRAYIRGEGTSLPWWVYTRVGIPPS